MITTQAFCPVRKWRVTAHVTERAFPCEIRRFHVGEVWQHEALFTIHFAPGYGSGSCCESIKEAFSAIEYQATERLSDALESIRDLFFTQALFAWTEGYEEQATAKQKTAFQAGQSNVVPLKKAA